MDKSTIRRINRLIVGIANGSEKSLEKLFSLTKRRLYLVAQSYLYDKSKVDDIVSNAYLRVVRHANSFDKSLNGYNWLYEIVKNLCYDANKYDREHMVENIENVVVRNGEYIDSMLDRVLISSATDVLESEEKRLIWLYYFEGYSLAEIAEMLKEPKSSVHYALHKVLKKLRTIIGEDR